MKILIILLIIICIIIHVKSTEFVYKTGSTFYKYKEYEIWDIIHSNFIDYSKYNYKKNFYLILFILPLLLNKINIDFIKEFVLKFLIIILLRSLTIISTILPKNNNNVKIDKKYNNLSLFDKIIGAGYDKMFSGHFAFGLLLTLLYFKYNILESNWFNTIIFFIINLIHLFILSITRSHYTMDMIVSLYVTLFVFICVKM
jgi:hypothetical protein